MVYLSPTRCSFIAILWVSLVSFAAITFYVASQRVFIVVFYFVMDWVRKLLVTPSYKWTRAWKQSATNCFNVIKYPTWLATKNNDPVIKLPKLQAFQKLCREGFFFCCCCCCCCKKGTKIYVLHFFTTENIHRHQIDARFPRPLSATVEWWKWTLKALCVPTLLAQERHYTASQPEDRDLKLHHRENRN
jgi:hypothetical protein